VRADGSPRDQGTTSRPSQWKCRKDPKTRRTGHKPLDVHTTTVPIEYPQHAAGQG
jgi:hypothetical protein